MSIPSHDPRLSQAGDHLVIASALGGQVRLVACRSSDLCHEAEQIHHLSPLSAVILGRALTGAVLLASDLKEKNDSLSLSVQSESALESLTVVAESDGSVRGEMVNTQLPSTVNEAGQLAVGQAVLPGQLTVVRSLGMKKPYSGTVKLVSGEIAEDLTQYLAESEQIPSAMLLGHKPEAEQEGISGGMLIQLMPGHDEETAAWVEARVLNFPEVSYWLQEGFTPAQLCDLLMGDPDIQYLDVRPIRYHCNCSRERMSAALLALGKGELEQLASDPKGIELVCHFCTKRYHFSHEELRELLNN